ncbi:MAG: oligoendopeptidase F, partial [Streptococcaceae bacterium]|nr:oligoendopeptidase F [Streptococcaceae bacterium]
MSEVKQLPKREEVRLEDTWDLEKIYVNTEAWEADFKKLEAIIAQSKEFRGTLAESSEKLLVVIKYFEQVYRLAENVYVYAHMKNDEDTANATYQALNARATSI